MHPLRYAWSSSFLFDASSLLSLLQHTCHLRSNSLEDHSHLLVPMWEKQGKTIRSSLEGMQPYRNRLNVQELMF